MFKRRVPWLLIFLLAFPLVSYCDIGCRVPDGRVFYGLLYVNQIRSTCSSLPADRAPYAHITGLHNGGAVCVVLINITQSLTGYQVDFIVLNCPLDDYSLPFAAAAGALGLFYIRRRTKN